METFKCRFSTRITMWSQFPSTFRSHDFHNPGLKMCFFMLRKSLFSYNKTFTAVSILYVPLRYSTSFHCPIHHGRKPRLSRFAFPLWAITTSRYRRPKKEKKVLVASLTLSLVCSPQISFTNQIPTFLPTQPAPLISPLFGYVKRGILRLYIGAALSICSYYSEHTVVSWAKPVCAAQFYFLTVTERTQDTM